MNNESNRRIAACAVDFALPRYAELPSVGLYLDQTVQYVNGYFRAFPGVELTASMVSNYVKKGIIGHPIKKKYTREQLAGLIYIVVSKTVLSMENIDTLFKMQRQHYSAAQAYDYFCEEVENCLPYVFGLTHTIRPRTPERRSCCSAAPSSPPSTRCFLTAHLPSCTRSRLSGRTSWRIWRKTCKRKSHAFAWLFYLSVRFRCPAIPRGWRP